VAEDITFLKIWDGLYKSVINRSTDSSLTVIKPRHTVEQVQVTPTNGAARHLKYTYIAWPSSMIFERALSIIKTYINRIYSEMVKVK
jgi:hypothetical protein